MAAKLGDVEKGAKFGDVEVNAVAGVKFGDTGVVKGAKFGEVDTKDAVKLGDVELVTKVAGAKLGDTDLVGISGRELGGVTKESVRFEAGDEVAKRAGKSGDVEATPDATASCANVLGHTASAPTSTWS